MIRRLTFLAILPVLLVAAAAPAMFPAKVMEWDEVMADWFAPVLARMGERPLWTEGSHGKAQAVYRFTFIGNRCQSTAIRIDEASESIRLRATVFDRCKHGRVSILRNARVISAADWQQAKDLMDQAELWKFEIGDWDGEDGWQWVDCTFVAMERARPGDYRISRSRISCIQPPKLLAVVNKVAALAGLTRPSLGYLDRSQGDTTH